MAILRRLRIIRGHPRLFLGVAASLVTGLALPGAFHLSTRLLIAWNVGTWLYFVTSLWLMAHANAATMRRRAKASDEGRFLILVLTSLAAFASIGAIVAQLGAVRDMSGLLKGLHIGLAAATILSAWFFIHLTYAFHYAHEYFDELEAEPGKPPKDVGGLMFPGTDNPDYFDFLYFSYIIGVASQTADVQITAKEMRRVSLAHSILAFFFNSAVLALTINIAAGLI
ncbi:DUF1345 domain-containing protein [Methylocapsa polymorpha]|uniref:DUF1345 domain-containing protein n=1 Tax=Methylocapsa polymorpha TaxID=3080828 RepID=A0ABZ0HSC1_9HYPH|nr:DUF1345 domain-containing protein [Methylocapsa sp. RX1]